MRVRDGNQHLKEKDMATRMEIVRYKADRTESTKSGWVLEGRRLDASRDCLAMLANAIAFLSTEARVLQVIKIPNREFQDTYDFGILVEGR
ncbi:MAG: hypothetical protein KF773_16140 [Deltaproteobacteria bacterium]|nr:hypothetical protein [Deltaproteobacteria bacterium]